ncbi:MAG: hypothetical protein L0Y79_03670 [Chlorobi bacterium]|nr:hypothetical protein [Chlorobiota bacterium]MCI0715458.1 hypothetical protein [Chlorobiota bacterium]
MLKNTAIKALLYSSLIIINYYTGHPIFAQWYLVNSGTMENLNSMYGSYGYVIVAGNNGTVIESIDSGKTWLAFQKFTNANLNYILKDGLKIFIVGDSGTCFRSTNGGDSWMQLNTNTSKKLNCAFFGGTRVYIVGDDGLILGSTNNGNSFTIRESNTTANLYYGVAGYMIVGANGTVLKSNNGGSTWYNINLGINSDLFFISSGYRYISGKDGTLLHNASDTTWNIIKTNTNETIYGITITGGSPYSIFYSCLSNGKILKSINGGDFLLQNIPGAGRISVIHFFTQYSGILISDNGKIFKNVSENYFATPKKIDVNTIATYFRNNGNFNRNPFTGNTGFEWPKGENKFARYSSGYGSEQLLITTHLSQFRILHMNICPAIQIPRVNPMARILYTEHIN